MITMRDIAMQVGVSRSTVSFVLNDKHSVMGVNEETRQRVLQAAEKMGYRRNELARAVVTGKNSVFAFLIWGAMLQSDVAMRVLGGLLDEAEARQYVVQVIRLNGTSDEKTIQRCVELRPTGVVGIYVSEETMAHVEREMAHFNIPIVVLDSTSLVTGASRVRSDDIDGCRQAISHLTDLGHTRIAYIGGNATSVASVLRLEGYRRAMDEHGLPVPQGYETLGKWDPAVVTQVTERLFSGETPHPTAVFCADDKTAMTACATIRRMGMSIPGDVSVVGFADLSMAPFNDPPLTTVAQPFGEMGRAAIRRLMAASSENEDGYSETNRDQLLPAHLIVRQSSGPAAS